MMFPHVRVYLYMCYDMQQYILKPNQTKPNQTNVHVWVFVVTQCTHVCVDF